MGLLGFVIIYIYMPLLPKQYITVELELGSMYGVYEPYQSEDRIGCQKEGCMSLATMFLLTIL